jgi:hypothetical protein
MKRAWLLVLLASCASFEDPTIVLDLRVLAIETTPPEQVLEIDPAKPPTLDELLVQLDPIRVRALVAEPDREGILAWSMTACVLDESSRCDPTKLSFEFAAGVLNDPEGTLPGAPCIDERNVAGGTFCGFLIPDNRVVQMLMQALDEDPTRGLGGIDLGIVLRVYNDGTTPRVEAFAAKHIRFAPRVPDERAANKNPNIDALLLGQAGFGAEIRKSHCMDVGDVDAVRVEEAVTFFPAARDGDNESFVLPTLDGYAERFTEFLSYQWIATAGDFVDDITGGPPDVFGNIKLDGTEWRAPPTPGLVTIWVVQRDSRYGVRWRQACIKVEP